MLTKFGSRVIHGCRIQICSQTSHNDVTKCKMQKKKKNSPKFMLTQLTLNIKTFQLPDCMMFAPNSFVLKTLNI